MRGRERKPKLNDYFSTLSDQKFKLSTDSSVPVGTYVVVEDIFDNNVETMKFGNECFDRKSPEHGSSISSLSAISSTDNADTAAAAAALLSLAENDSFIDVLSFKQNSPIEGEEDNNTFDTSEIFSNNKLYEVAENLSTKVKRKYRKKLKNLSSTDSVAFITAKRLQKEKKLKKAAILARLAGSKNEMRKVFTLRNFDEENKILNSFGNVSF